LGSGRSRELSPFILISLYFRPNAISAQPLFKQTTPAKSSAAGRFLRPAHIVGAGIDGVNRLRLWTSSEKWKTVDADKNGKLARVKQRERKKAVPPFLDGRPARKTNG
jgi:hypothetical protein